MGVILTPKRPYKRVEHQISPRHIPVNSIYQLPPRITNACVVNVYILVIPHLVFMRNETSTLLIREWCIRVYHLASSCEAVVVVVWWTREIKKSGIVWCCFSCHRHAYARKSSEFSSLLNLNVSDSFFRAFPRLHFPLKFYLTAFFFIFPIILPPFSPCFLPHRLTLSDRGVGHLVAPPSIFSAELAKKKSTAKMTLRHLIISEKTRFGQNKFSRSLPLAVGKSLLGNLVHFSRKFYCFTRNP